MEYCFYFIENEAVKKTIGHYKDGITQRLLWCRKNIIY